MTPVETPATERSNVARNTALRRLALLLALFTAALAFRVDHLGESRLIAERQFRSAVIARAFYFEATDSISDWRRNVARDSRRQAGVVEPPITEVLVSIVYRTVGKVRLWMGGVFPTIFWLLGSFALYRISRRFVPFEGACFATAYFLFLPLGVVASVSFLPDPLMLMMMLFSILATLRFDERPNPGRLWCAAAVAGISGLIKPFCLFSVIAVYLALAQRRSGSWKRVFDAQLLIFLSVSLLLGASYYLYGIFVSGSMSSNLRAGFLPSLLLDPEHWSAWIATAGDAVGSIPLVTAVLGLPLLPKGRIRSVLAGLVVGYFLFGFAYTTPFTGASYYHLQLAVVVALALAPVASLMVRSIARADRRLAGVVLVTSLILAAFFADRAVDRRLDSFGRHISPERAREIGEIVGHSTRTVYIASFYGMPLVYYAEISGTYWRMRLDNDKVSGDFLWQSTGDFIRWLVRRPAPLERSVRDRFEGLDFRPEYFVVSNLARFERFHSDVRSFLDDHCALVAAEPDFLVYRIEDCASW